MNEWVWTIPLVFWLVMLLLPWQPWRNRETLRVTNPAANADLSDISVIIPARNEASQISRTLQALIEQGENLLSVLWIRHGYEYTQSARIWRGFDAGNCCVGPCVRVRNRWQCQL